MRSFPRSVVSPLLTAGLCATLWASAHTLTAQTSIRQVKIVPTRGAVEIEVEASDRIVPQTRVLTGPDRLVVDFPNSVPGKALLSQSVNQGNVKDVRFGLLQAKPPVTRLVLDLKAAQSYQIFPYGRTVMIKVIGAAAEGTPAIAEASSAAPAARPGLVNTNYTVGAERVQTSVPAKPALEVSFRDGQLAIRANKATFSEVLFAVQQRTGADIAIPAGAEQERVVADLGPGPAQEDLASLLNGSNFNFLILNSSSDPRQLERVILTPRGGGAFAPSGPPPQASDGGDDDAANEPRPDQPATMYPQPRPDAPAVRVAQPQNVQPPPTPPEEDAPSPQ